MCGRRRRELPGATAKPAAPTFANVGQTRFRTVWTAPPTASSPTASSPTTGYAIEYKPSSEPDDAYRAVTPAPRAGGRRGYNIITRRGQFITPGTAYDVRVRERNAHGWGPWSDPATVTTTGDAPVAHAPPGKPDAPAFANVGQTRFRTVWTMPPAGSSPITGYAIEYKPSSEPDDAYRAVTPAPRAGGRRGYNIITRRGQFITPGTAYDVRVRERNAHGWGPWSDPATVTTTGDAPVAHAPPGKPDAPAFANVGQTRFRTVWTAPPAGSSPITGYAIEYKPSSEPDDAYRAVTPAPRGTTKGYNVVNRATQNITPATTYHVRIRARNAHGWSQWSQPATITTTSTPQPE
jgi:hypothetical protein